MNTRRKGKALKVPFSMHHTIPVAELGIEGIDWHLKHLFNAPDGYEGFKTIKIVTQKEHLTIHAKKSKKTKVRA